MTCLALRPNRHSLGWGSHPGRKLSQRCTTSCLAKLPERQGQASRIRELEQKNASGRLSGSSTGPVVLAKGTGSERGFPLVPTTISNQGCVMNCPHQSLFLACFRAQIGCRVNLSRRSPVPLIELQPSMGSRFVYCLLRSRDVLDLTYSGMSLGAQERGCACSSFGREALLASLFVSLLGPVNVQRSHSGIISRSLFSYVDCVDQYLQLDAAISSKGGERNR